MKRLRRHLLDVLWYARYLQMVRRIPLSPAHTRKLMSRNSPRIVSQFSVSCWYFKSVLRFLALSIVIFYYAVYCSRTPRGRSVKVGCVGLSRIRHEENE